MEDRAWSAALHNLSVSGNTGMLGLKPAVD